jgi:hypothetical protein
VKADVEVYLHAEIVLTPVIVAIAAGNALAGVVIRMRVDGIYPE